MFDCDDCNYFIFKVFECSFLRHAEDSLGILVDALRLQVAHLSCLFVSVSLLCVPCSIFFCASACLFSSQLVSWEFWGSDT